MIIGIYFIIIILSYCLSNIMYRKMNLYNYRYRCVYYISYCVYKRIFGRIIFCFIFLISVGGMKLNGLKCEL